jgi:formate hydrogenlyase transcriptional activator
MLLAMAAQNLRLLRGGIDLDEPVLGAEARLGLESLRREHRLILQAAGEGIYGLDSEGRAIFVNPAAAEMTGHSAEQLLGRSMHELVHHSHPSGEAYTRTECPIYAAIRDGITRKASSDTFWRKDGTSFAVEYTSTPIIEGRKVVGAVVVFRDVTARQATEERLQHALAELHSLREGSPREGSLREGSRSADHSQPGLDPERALGAIVGVSPAVQSVLDLIRRAAACEVPLLVQGETGTGKELVCRAVHELGPRRSQPLVSVNCAAISPSLIESELFGHERGAFTGALTQRAGRFEQAASGTLLLDEVSELPLESQAKLLRVLQERSFQRVGGERELRTTARVIAATNRDLLELVRAGKFRADLYYRLYVLAIAVPPLRERRMDVRPLAEHFLRCHEAYSARRFEGFAPGALARLEQHDWPGNVRELRHTIERAALLCDGPELVIDARSLPTPHEGSGERSASGAEGLAGSARPPQLGRDDILRALEKARFRISGPRGAAAALGLHPNTLRSRMSRLGLTRGS